MTQHLLHCYILELIGIIIWFLNVYISDKIMNIFGLENLKFEPRFSGSLMRRVCGCRLSVTGGLGELTEYSSAWSAWVSVSSLRVSVSVDFRFKNFKLEYRLQISNLSDLCTKQEIKINNTKIKQVKNLGFINSILVALKVTKKYERCNIWRRFVILFFSNCRS